MCLVATPSTHLVDATHGAVASTVRTAATPPRCGGGTGRQRRRRVWPIRCKKSRATVGSRGAVMLGSMWAVLTGLCRALGVEAARDLNAKPC